MADRKMSGGTRRAAPALPYPRTSAPSAVDVLFGALVRKRFRGRFLEPSWIGPGSSLLRPGAVLDGVWTRTGSKKGRKQADFPVIEERRKKSAGEPQDMHQPPSFPNMQVAGIEEPKMGEKKIDQRRRQLANKRILRIK